MASLRDVFQHAGKPVQVLLEGKVRAQGKMMRRGDVVLLEAHLAPRVGEVLEVAETGERLRVKTSEPQHFQEKVDHFRATVEPVRG